jgi:hypothetical protein
MNARRCTVTFITALALGGCSPTQDWRTVELPEGRLKAALPCRPGRFERQVELADQHLSLFMLSCEAGGVTYALATADVGDPSKVEGVLVAMTASASAAIGGTAASTPLQLRGATPFRGNASTRLLGTRPNGTPVQEIVAVFGQGTRVFEAMAIGDSLDAAATEPFLDALEFEAAL